MTTEAVSHRLVMTLPKEWKIITGDTLRETDFGSEFASLTPHLEAFESLIDDPDVRPDLMAALSLPLFDDAGQPIAAIFASLIATTISSSRAPAADDPRWGMSVLADVEVAPGLLASYLVYTAPIASDDGEVTTLLTFSSPNLPMRAFLEAGFASLASGARVEAPGEVGSESG